MEISTVIAVLFWIAFVCILSYYSPFLGFLVVLPLLKYFD
jgi:hypothetical protein